MSGTLWVATRSRTSRPRQAGQLSPRPHLRRCVLANERMALSFLVSWRSSTASSSLRPHLRWHGAFCDEHLDHVIRRSQGQSATRIIATASYEVAIDVGVSVAIIAVPSTHELVARVPMLHNRQKLSQALVFWFSTLCTIECRASRNQPDRVLFQPVLVARHFRTRTPTLFSTNTCCRTKALAEESWYVRAAHV